MSKTNRSSDFPRTEEFVDFAGRTRKFIIKLDELPLGYVISAVEDVEGDDGYPTPWPAAGRPDHRRPLRAAARGRWHLTVDPLPLTVQPHRRRVGCWLSRVGRAAADPLAVAARRHLPDTADVVAGVGCAMPPLVSMPPSHRRPPAGDSASLAIDGLTPLSGRPPVGLIRPAGPGHLRPWPR